MPSILVVDDEQSICWGLTRLGESLGHEVIAASSAEQAIVHSAKPDFVSCGGDGSGQCSIGMAAAGR